MSVVRSAAVAVLIAASASLAPLPGTSTTAQAQANRCPAYQPGERTPERRELMEALVEAINQSDRRGERLRTKKVWLACNYARVIMTPRGRGQQLDALMVRINGEWRFGMIADPDPAAGPAASQFTARYSDIPDVLVYWN